MTERVLVPIDGSDDAWAALEYALDSYPDATVTVVHVIEVARSVPSMYQAPGNVELADETAERRAEELLERAASRGAERGVDVETRRLYGAPSRKIVAYVEDHDVDHVVMGNRGRTGLSRVLLGSVAEFVVRHSPVPVTIHKTDRTSE